MALNHAVGGTHVDYDDAPILSLDSSSMRVPGSPSASDGGHTPVTEVAAAVPVDHDNDPRVDQIATSVTLTPTLIEDYTIWSKIKVRLICITVAFAGLFSPLSSNSYFPALPTIAASL
ncbi:hypothetical protein MVLG_02067 [Microbotryum lychnidis-dioicae p1A1 Lamole]|uniref:Uncharacterized protein n=1 Tax=Microbotryum lychnidis-dioicae (strain p1A1 Lamole / MvSl-1064) TaxID=683840 RepID=U5H416_USTV1|nr:hypothetical protein MVLG_02067 [Microbotryum lychnidis-dioicae p1A1 Lamole]|eukprot:KDE07601.1 hypothetical protein MVLG_02067 [Microbotryum lychnidis-dioicae p1A1 Lamole]